MNITQNNRRLVLQHQQANINVLGNNNLFVVVDSQLSAIVTGNNNKFEVRSSNVSFVVNGNNNYVEAGGSKVAYGFNGNNNTLAADSQCQINHKFDNGFNNSHPQIARNQPQQPPSNNRNASRNRNVQQQPLRRNRNPPPAPNYYPPPPPQQQNRVSHNNNNLRNLWRNVNSNNQRVERENYQPPQPPRINIFSNQQGYGVAPIYDNPQFLQQMGNIFPQFVHQNRVFQFGPQFRQFRFQFNGEGDDSQEEDKGLSREELNLLPSSKHKGKTASCTICLCEVQQNEEQTFLMCFHSFHSPCIKSWLTKNGTCPVCQFDLRQHLRGK